MNTQRNKLLLFVFILSHLFVFASDEYTIDETILHYKNFEIKDTQDIDDLIFFLKNDSIIIKKNQVYHIFSAIEKNHHKILRTQDEVYIKKFFYGLSHFFDKYGGHHLGISIIDDWENIGTARLSDEIKLFLIKTKGIYFDKIGNIEKAIDIFNEGLKLTKDRKDYKMEADFYHHLAGEYQILYEEDTVLNREVVRLHKKSYELYEKADYQFGVGWSLVQLGLYEKEWPKIKSSVEKGLDILSYGGDLNYKFAILSYIDKLLIINKLEKAKEYSDKLKKETKNCLLDSRVALINSKINALENNDVEAYKILNEAIAITAKMNNKWDKKENYERIGEVYALLEDYEKAYDFNQIYLELDKKLSRQTNHWNSELERFYSELSEHQAELFAQKLKNRSHKIALITLIVLLSFGLILGLMMYKTYTRKKNYNTRLEGFNKSLNAQKERLKHKNDQLELMLDRRGKVIERLQKFASVLSHDFKEPIRMINSFGKLLDLSARSKIDESEKEFLNFMVDGAVRLNKMVEVLYKYSNNTLTLLNSFSKIDLNTTIYEVIQDLGLKIKESQATIKVEALPDILGQESMVYQLFQNIIANALKYRKPNVTPQIEIDVRSSNGKYLIAIKDNGIGIPVKQRNEMFKLFKRAKNAMDVDGHGIGLATCKEIMEIHGGDIWFESEIGVGTTFYLLFEEEDKM